MNHTEKLNVALFCGGRGAGTIIEVLAKHPQIALTLIVNTYDDGLSTGMLRRFVPGMLGPSDVRKNCSRLINKEQLAALSLHELIEFRFPVKITNEQAEKDLLLISQGEQPQLEPIRTHFLNLSVLKALELKSFCSLFLQYRKTQSFDLKYQDCSLGNILFTGCYLSENKDFNKAVKRFSELCGIHTKVLNVTDGSNRVLTGVKEDGSYIRNEAELVGEQSAVPVREIFLLEKYLDKSDEEKLVSLSITEKIAFLRKLETKLPANPEVLSSIQSADLIIYGPGTQHSSLFPSYLTEKLAEAIASNKKAEKIFVANIRKDYEIQKETVESLTSKLSFYLSRKRTASVTTNDLITKCFFQTMEDEAETQYISASRELAVDSNSLASNWELNPGVHLGGKVVDELLAIANAKVQTNLKALPYMVSIIVPALNEERTVRKVLHDLVLLNFQSIGLSKEIIFVDGGSTDRTLENAKQESTIRICEMPKGTGRGEALRAGIDKAQGNVIVFFHSDGEYAASDLPKVVLAIAQNEFKVVFGSRVIKCVDHTDRIREIYRGNYFGYLMGKYGGFILSILSQFLYNRFISDPLTGIKAFDARTLRSLNLKSKGMNLETEMIAKLGKKKTFIMELPVEYFPRKKNEGKKSTLWDGLSSLWTLIRCRWSQA